jgi:PEP-CTERM motif
MRRLLFSLAALCASSAAAPALAGNGGPPPPPPPPPRVGTTLDITGDDGLSLGLTFSDALPAISTDAVAFNWGFKLGVPIRLGDVTAGDLLPGVIGDPTFRLSLIGTATPYDNPYFNLSGGAVLESKYSDLTPRPYLFLAVTETVSSLQFSVEARYSVGDEEFDLRHEFTVVGRCVYRIPNRAAVAAPIGDRYDCDLDEVTGVTTARAVPEPSTWAITVLGLGAAGAALRRRRRTAGASVQPHG